MWSFCDGLIFMFIAVPCIPLHYQMGSHALLQVGFPNDIRKVLGVLLALSLCIGATPGFYLPPFFNGIAGWTYQVSDPERYERSDLRNYLQRW